MVFRTATNTEMVDRAVNLITKRGLTPATGHDMRARFAATEVDESERISVFINRNHCLGWGVCYSHAPEVYQTSTPRATASSSSPTSTTACWRRLSRAWRAAPERAIRVELCVNT